MKLQNEKLFEYIESNFTNKDYIEINNQNTDSLHEGFQTTIKVNKYERNPIAREECITKYGTRCRVCGMNFKKNMVILELDLFMFII